MLLRTIKDSFLWASHFLNQWNRLVSLAKWCLVAILTHHIMVHVRNVTLDIYCKFGNFRGGFISAKLRKNYAKFRENISLAKGWNHSDVYWYGWIMPWSRISNVANISFKAICEHFRIYSTCIAILRDHWLNWVSANFFAVVNARCEWTWETARMCRLARTFAERRCYTSTKTVQWKNLSVS